MQTSTLQTKHKMKIKYTNSSQQLQVNQNMFGAFSHKHWHFVFQFLNEKSNLSNKVSNELIGWSLLAKERSIWRSCHLILFLFFFLQQRSASGIELQSLQTWREEL